MNNGHDKAEDNMKTVINKGLETAKEVIEEQAARLKEKVEGVEWSGVPSNVKSYVKREPLKSLAIAIGIGFLAGYILKSTGRSKE